MRIYYLTIALICGCLCFACEDSLRLLPENSVTFDNAFENEHELEVGLLTVEKYIRRSLAASSITSRKGCYSDEHYSNDFALLLENDISWYTQQWDGPYKVIAMANTPLPYIDQIDMPQERRDFYKGQIYFSKEIQRKIPEGISLTTRVEKVNFKNKL